MAAPGLGSLAKLAWRWLWETHGRQKPRFTVRYIEIAVALGRTERSARRWVSDLRGAGLVRLIDELGRGGAIELEMVRPTDALKAIRIKRHSPQLSLGFMDATAEPLPEPPSTIPFDRSSPRKKDFLPDEFPNAG
jgi:hypothetical protein